jgi:glycosyltransferase involved in cell wall biosynthesis
MNRRDKKRIGIDARFYGPPGKGLGRYVQEIVDNVVKIDQESEFVVFLGRQNYDEFLVSEPRIKKVLVFAGWYSFAEQVAMPWIIWREHLDLMHFPHFNVPIFTPVKFVVTIHDLILTKFPTVRATTLSPWLYWLKNIFYKIVISSAVKRSQKIIAVSEFTKNDIVDKFKVRSEKVVVTYEGVANLSRGNDSLFVKKMDDRNTLLSYNILSNYILYVGNAYPHKNLEGLLDVFGELHKKYPALRLVLVGKEDYFYKRLKEFSERLGLWNEGVADSPVIFTGYVPDVELEVLYRQALFYVFPSFYEGFGLPALEAMDRGCSVASSNQASLPEILGDAALYFDPKDKAEMFLKLDRLYHDEELRLILIKKGHEQIRRYNWWECARKTVDVYHSILNKK